MDVTDELHPDVMDLARKVLGFFAGLPCVGIDVMFLDPARALTGDDHWVLEVNSNPGLATHAYPHGGARTRRGRLRRQRHGPLDQARRVEP